MGNEQRQHQDGKRVPIFIPSHTQVMEHSRPQPPPSLFRPSSSSSPNPSNSSSTAPSLCPHPPPPNSSASSVLQSTSPSFAAGASGQASSFTEAFSFVRKTEFYSPPPALPSHTVPHGVSGIGTSSSIGQELKQESLLPTVAAGQARNAILVSRRQQGNPVLKHIRNVRWIFTDIVPDYILGQNSCALYLSLRYHLLHPDYIFFRIRELQKSFRLRVVLCHVDVEDVIKPLHEVTKTALLHDCSLMCAWSLEECARYLETIKIYENKPADNIQERTDHDYLSRLTSALMTVRHVNKTDVVTLGSSFGTLAAVMGASMEDLARCPGIGERKVKRLYDAFHEPFRRTSKQVRLSSVGVTSSSAKEEAITRNDPENQPSVETSEGTPSENKLTVQPEVSVRETLGAAHAKCRRRLTSSDQFSKNVKAETKENAPSLLSMDK